MWFNVVLMPDGYWGYFTSKIIVYDRSGIHGMEDDTFTFVEDGKTVTFSPMKPKMTERVKVKFY